MADVMMGLIVKLRKLERRFDEFASDVEIERTAFGSMYNHDTPTTVTISAMDTAVRVPGGFTEGKTNLATFQNSREIVVLRAGIYKTDWQISFTMAAGANQEIEGFVMINNAMNVQASAHRKITIGTDTESMSGTCELDLAASDVVALGMLNESSTNNPVVEHANMTINQVGRP